MSMNSLAILKNFKLAKNIMFHSCWIGNLHAKTQESDLIQEFGKFGSIKKIFISKAKDGEDKCFAYVNYETMDEAKLAASEGSKILVLERAIETIYKPPREKKRESSPSKVILGNEMKTPEKKISSQEPRDFTPERKTPNRKWDSPKSPYKSPSKDLVSSLESMQITQKSYFSKTLNDSDVKMYRAAAILPLKKIGVDGKEHVLLGLESGQLVFLGGKIEDIDGGDPIVTALREFWEETGSIVDRDLVHQGIFGNVAWIATGKLALYLARDNIDLDLPIKHLESDKKSEIESLHWIELSVLLKAVNEGTNIVTISNVKMPIKRFAVQMIRFLDRAKAFV